MKDFKGKIPTFKFDVKGQSGELPQVGLGTAGLDGERCVSAVVEALKQGYRVIDTALLYGNQLEVGEGVRKSGLDRKDVWITSKVAFFPPNSDDLWAAADHKGLNDKGGEEASINLTLKQLGVDYVDLLLIHNPAASKEEYSAAAVPQFFEILTYQGKEEAVRPERLPDGDNIRDLITQAKRQRVKEAKTAAHALTVRKGAWQAMEKALRQGKAKYIGVSNYPVELLDQMQSYANVMPCVNQLELHPGFSSPPLRTYAQSNGIALIGYGSLLSHLIDAGDRRTLIDTIAHKHGKTPNQVVLKWTISRNVAVIPRSGSAEHIAENAALFDWQLSEDELLAIDKLNVDRPYYWDPVATILTVVG